MAAKAKTGPGRAGGGPGRSATDGTKKGRRSGGRTTPSGTRNVRYTPPIPKKVRSSPRWMGFAILAFFLLGVVIVILNYAGLLPGGVNNLWLVGAIGSIFVGLLLATRYR